MLEYVTPCLGKIVQVQLLGMLEGSWSIVRWNLRPVIYLVSNFARLQGCTGWICLSLVSSRVSLTGGDLNGTSLRCHGPVAGLSIIVCQREFL